MVAFYTCNFAARGFNFYSGSGIMTGFSLGFPQSFKSVTNSILIQVTALSFQILTIRDYLFAAFDALSLATSNAVTN
jgi:hypothetical protein